MTEANDIVERLEATPKQIAAAWATWHARHGGKLGPGPAFVEAINAALNADTRIRSAIECTPSEDDLLTPAYMAGVEAGKASGIAEGMERAAVIIEEGYDRSIARKVDACAHGKFEWEDCEQCAVVAIRAAKEVMK